MYNATITAVGLYVHRQFYVSVHMMFCGVIGRSRLYFTHSGPQHKKRFSNVSFELFLSLRTECIAQNTGIKRAFNFYRKTGKSSETFQECLPELLPFREGANVEIIILHMCKICVK